MPLLQDDSSSPRPLEIAAIDLGSNSFHMIIARVVNGALQVLSRLKQRVYLADGLDDNDKLSEEAMLRGLSALSLFAERLQGFPAENVTVVGTHTLRVASNAKVFLQRAKEVMPYPIEIISGHEEARLIFMGVEHTQSEKGRKLVIDIGGGSTELVIGENFEPILIESQRMGCVSFSRQFFPNQKISESAFRKAREKAARKMEKIAWQYKMTGWDVALGASGTIKAAHEILVEFGEKDGVITPERLLMLTKQVLRFKKFKDITLPGLSDERKHSFVPGLAILCGIFDTLGLKALHLSDGALREGVLYEMEGRFRHQDIRQRTAKSLAEHYNIDREQAKRVLTTMQSLYAQWAEQNPKLVRPDLEAILVWAVMLHEVGLSINLSGLHRHSAYILSNTDLPGFNQEQQQLLTTLVRYHRKAIKFDELPKFNLYKKKQYYPLVQILRLATLLNNQRQSTTKPVSLRLVTDDNHWTLYFPKNYLADNTLMELDLEKEQEHWQTVPGWKLDIKEESA
ncbi:exopolyphosphatase [Proteus mirabilis]|uniref:exopolyphosphatase n=1 Tax=Proteus TaxID=583 RepID=UPI0013781D0B|nr:exopolyphosphatase [Proteus sp. G2675]MBG5943032.1 exopolyphosphatase [Proteus mirabilis]NBL95194.1 exopolyphosphatase [Proteus sp. G2675]HEI8691473.1 exopolyphosphatase [Proteus mirabilis]HEK1923059.1 exopolyphosphatase [Proteus mirabilis]